MDSRSVFAAAFDKKQKAEEGLNNPDVARLVRDPFALKTQGKGPVVRAANRVEELTFVHQIRVPLDVPSLS